MEMAPSGEVTCQNPPKNCSCLRTAFPWTHGRQRARFPSPAPTSCAWGLGDWEAYSPAPSSKLRFVAWTHPCPSAGHNLPVPLTGLGGFHPVLFHRPPPAWTSSLRGSCPTSCLGQKVQCQMCAVNISSDYFVTFLQQF